MRFSRKTRTAVAAATGGLLLAASLTGCGGQAGAGDGGSATEGSITWWSWTPDNNVAADEIAAFNEEYPDIEVTFKKVPTDNYAALLKPALASNDGPDVYTVAASGAFSAESFAPYATDLTPGIEALLGADWKSKVFAGGTDAFTVDDRLVASEWAKVGAGIMWINKATFDQYDLEPPTTLDEWESVCATFRANGLGCFREGMAGTAGFVVDTLHSIADSVDPTFWGKALKGEAEWSDPAFVQTLEILRDLQERGILDEGAVGVQQYPDVNNAFLTGKVPMVQMGTWYSQYSVQKNLQAGVEGAGGAAGADEVVSIPIPFPDVAGKGNPSTMFADPDAGHSVNAKSPNRNAATTFALWMGNTEAGQQAVVNNLDSFATLNGVSAQFDQVDLVDPEVQRPALEDITTQLGEATVSRSLGISAELNQALIDASQAMVNSDKPAADAAKDVQAVAAAASGS